MMLDKNYLVNLIFFATSVPVILSQDYDALVSDQVSTEKVRSRAFMQCVAKLC